MMMSRHNQEFEAIKQRMIVKAEKLIPHTARYRAMNFKRIM